MILGLPQSAPLSRALSRALFLRLCVFPLLVVAAAILPRGALAEIEVVRGPYLVADVTSGAVYEHHDALRPWYPASTTKMMTAYVTFRAIETGEITLQSPVRISEKAAAQPPSKMGFRPGSTLTVDNALKIIMVKSANDIALALAEAVGGSEEAFAARMNAEARRLGMSRSHFVNPHGLPDPRQVTTARDMALLARAMLVELPQYRSYYNIPAIQYGQNVMQNFNGLVSRYPGTTGMKTGFICSSGFNLVASARRGNKEIVAVVFGAYSGPERAERAAALLEEGFKARGPLRRARTSLANVSSGVGYREPLDMRPEICTEKRKQVQEAVVAEPELKTLHNGLVVRMRGAPQLGLPLGPPRDMGPPLRVALRGATAGTEAAAAPLPRARPLLKQLPQPTGLATAFAATATVPAAAVTEAAIREEPARDPRAVVPLPRPRPARPQ